MKKFLVPGKWLIGLFAGMLACGMNSQLQAQDFDPSDITPASLPFTFNGGKSDINPSEGIFQNGLINDYKTEPKLKFSNTGTFVVVAFDNIPGTVSFSFKGNRNTQDGQSTMGTSSFVVEGSENGTSWTEISRYTGDDEIPMQATEETLDNLESDIRYIRWTYTKDLGNVAFGNITITEGEETSTDPSLSLQPSSFSLKAEVDATDEGTMVVSGRNLKEDVKVALSGDDAAMFSLSAATLSAAELMADGIELTITYAPTAEGDHTAALTFSNEEVNKTATIKGSTESQQEEGSYPTLASLYDLYNEDIDPEAIYTITGDVVVTHKDDYNTRIYVQDADMTNGASMLLFRAEDYGYAELQAGDVIKNLTGTMEVYNGLLEFKPTETLTASAHDHEIHITDATVAEINADPVAYQSALLRVKNVSFEESGEFALTENGRGVNYSLLQGEDILVFRTEFADADYIGTAIPEGSLDITGIMTQYNEDAQLSARSLADIVPADTTGSECEAPSNLQVECTTRLTDPYFDTYEYNAHFTWEGSASAYLFMVIQSSDTVQMDTVTDTFADITVAEVKWVITSGEWAVASICEDGSLAWSETLPFEITENKTMEAMDVRLYPNPTSGRFYLETDCDARVEVFSTNGTLIESLDLNAGLNEMNLRQKGVYFVRVSNGKALTVKRVVVR